MGLYDHYQNKNMIMRQFTCKCVQKMEKGRAGMQTGAEKPAAYNKAKSERFFAEGVECNVSCKACGSRALP